MRQAFLLGLVLGVLSALGFLTFGTPGLLIVLIGLVWSMRFPWALSSLSGLLIGIGASVLLLTTAAAARCASANQSGPGFESSCMAPDSTLLLTFAAAVVAAGLAIGLVVARRPIAERVTRRAAPSPD
jgi:4-amino-4-deoxy-L-arabinose transferase-like glycosyltransferase